MYQLNFKKSRKKLGKNNTFFLRRRSFSKSFLRIGFTNFGSIYERISYVILKKYDNLIDSMTATIDQIKELVSNGESETLEFKKSTALLNECGEALCGFLNHKGGTIIIGVSQEGKIVGQTVTDRTLQEVANIIGKISPEPKIEIERIPLTSGQSELLLLHAIHSPKLQPFVYSGRPFIRRGTTTVLMTQGRYHQALFERSYETHRWELSIAEGFHIDDLDTEEILATVRFGRSAGRIPEQFGSDIDDMLDRLKLRIDKKFLKKAAVVLFAKDPMPEYSQCKIQMARFKGNTKSEFLDSKQVYGNAFAIFSEALLFLQRHLPVASRIDPTSPIRIDELLFPIEALREALVNAICHRDYTSHSGSISLAIFDDRLEIWNTGVLPTGLTIEDLKKDHESKPRNPLIAEIFYKRGLFESWGRGTQKIVELCTRAGHPEPEFLEQAGSFVVRFIQNGYHPPYQVPHNLSDLDREILQILSRSDLPTRDLIKHLKEPPAVRTINEHLTQLKQLKLVDSKRRGRSTLWHLKKPIKSNN